MLKTRKTNRSKSGASQIARVVSSMFSEDELEVSKLHSSGSDIDEISKRVGADKETIRELLSEYLFHEMYLK